MPALMAVLSKIPGKSIVEETIFLTGLWLPPELCRMGANIKIKKNNAIIIGQKFFNGADCISSDLRTTFAIILGALSSNGKSEIQKVYHGLRILSTSF